MKFTCNFSNSRNLRTHNFSKLKDKVIKFLVNEPLLEDSVFKCYYKRMLTKISNVIFIVLIDIYYPHNC